jgi:hypothetical protein
MIRAYRRAGSIPFISIFFGFPGISIRVRTRGQYSRKDKHTPISLKVNHFPPNPWNTTVSIPENAIIVMEGCQGNEPRASGLRGLNLTPKRRGGQLMG